MALSLKSTRKAVCQLASCISVMHSYRYFLWKMYIRGELTGWQMVKGNLALATKKNICFIGKASHFITITDSEFFLQSRKVANKMTKKNKKANSDFMSTWKRLDPRLSRNVSLFYLHWIKSHFQHRPLKEERARTSLTLKAQTQSKMADRNAGISQSRGGIVTAAV